MKLSTSVVYRHRLIPPKGMIFSSEKLDVIQEALGKDTEFSIDLTGHVLM